LRQWSGTSPDMEQPALDHHYVVLHLGGAKRVERWHDGAPVTKIVDCGALTIVPAGTQFSWRTQGPIQFAHLYLAPQRLANVAARVDCSRELTLLDRVGVRDGLLESLYRAMLEAARDPTPPLSMYMDSLLETFVIRLLVGHSAGRLRSPARRETLPKYRLARVLEFIDANLASELTLADLSRVAGSSVFHFSRAFRNAQGVPPHRYLLELRIERAKALLLGGPVSLAALATLCGFHDATHLSRTFTRLVGVSPRQFRKQ
jgi:AraC family transcriptional regulator